MSENRKITKKADVDLLSYLPDFLREYKEFKEIAGSENPQFEKLWNAADSTLYNMFILSSDQYGVERFEKLLNIFPDKTDTLETRKNRILNKWQSKLPYTCKMLLYRLSILCGNDFQIKKDFDNYRIKITTHFREYSPFAEVKKLLKEMIPANMSVQAVNSVSFDAEGKSVIYCGLKPEGKHKIIRIKVKRV